jgi:CTP:molybdopterin cytidylyltransferase MocA
MTGALIILAAGKSTRMGFPKGLARLANGKSLLSAIISAAENAGTEAVYVACSPTAVAAYSAIVAETSAQFITIDHWQADAKWSLLQSLKFLLNAADVKRPILFMPVDCPVTDPEIYRQLSAAIASGAAAAKPTFRGRGGHPVALSRDIAVWLVGQLDSSLPLNKILQKIPSCDFLRLAVDHEAVCENWNGSDQTQLTSLLEFHHQHILSTGHTSKL